jgi:ribosomal protein S18 acetylase RimI-like enzyme
VVFEACRGEQLLGAIWVQRQPGRTASFEPAQVVEQAVGIADDADRLAETLMQHAIAFAVEGGARMMQTLLETDGGTDARRLQDAGFQHMAELLYLVSDRSTFPDSAPAEALEFEPLGPATRIRDENAPVQLFDRHSFSRLAEIVQRTYVGTLDCPQLDGVRPIAEILEGYRAVGRFNPAHWLLVLRDGRYIGCLLLAEHAQETWELVYMGLIPEARGRGWGLEMVRYAQWLARGGIAQRMVLAVDVKNGPAIDMYAAAGFETWDRRSAWLRIL